MDAFFNYLKTIKFEFLDAIEIVLLAVCVYFVAVYIKKLNARWYNKFLFITLLLGIIIGVSDLNMARTVFPSLIITIILSTVIIFNQDIKRGVWKLSRQKKRLLDHTDSTAKKEVSDDDLREIAADIVKATQNLAKKNVGALMIFTRTSLPAQILESGVSLKAEVTSQLIETIFAKNTPLHDGASIISENTLIAASCFLPLSIEINIPKELGTRHRAAIGITESLSDAVALVVSEETGIISIAYQGKIYRYLDNEQLSISIEAAVGLRSLDEMPFLAASKEEDKDAEI